MIVAHRFHALRVVMRQLPGLARCPTLAWDRCQPTLLRTPGDRLEPDQQCQLHTLGRAQPAVDPLND
ncbi:MAG: hypothetical protein RIQ93_3101 [Verrucomicrobiota bacterium]|jgi:hypothetical protein